MTEDVVQVREQVREVPGARVSATLGATIGNMLEFYDFITFAFFAVQIGRTFFPSHSAYASLMGALATFGAGFITRPLGGIVIGLYSDRAGRKPAMILSFTMMGVAIIVLALTPSYESIGIAAPIIAILARMVQGFSLGGEVGPTTAYLLESAPPHRRGFAVSWQPASQEIAATIGAVVGLVLSTTLSSSALDAYGWRIAFLLGAVTLPFGLWMRTRMPETMHLPEEAAHAMPEAQVGAQAGVWRAHTRVFVLGLLILASGTIATYVTKYMTTYAETTLQVAPSLAFAASVAGNALGFAGALLGGWLADRYGRRPLMVWPQLAALLLTYPVFLWIVDTKSPAALLGGFGVLSLIGTIPYTAFYAAMTESLPKRIRGGAFAILYAAAITTFGGTAQLVVTWLLHVTGNALAPAWYLLFSGTVGLIAMTLMRETAPGRTP
ncbi:MFS transporter [Bradyrhizobium prioriisuperbiae]|uniref:MFS transporter n=1 Tax=Bradyrhizobium prioriisuperbiae TaxID=2854389 RepID=UPI0028E59D04|nr:MFS transporter [Bradyrhizobium prioritasuperba]